MTLRVTVRKGKYSGNPLEIHLPFCDTTALVLRFLRESLHRPDVLAFDLADTVTNNKYNKRANEWMITAFELIGRDRRTMLLSSQSNRSGACSSSSSLGVPLHTIRRWADHAVTSETLERHYLGFLLRHLARSSSSAIFCRRRRSLPPTGFKLRAPFLSRGTSEVREEATTERGRLARPLAQHPERRPGTAGVRARWEVRAQPRRRFGRARLTPLGPSLSRPRRTWASQAPTRSGAIRPSS
mmetsp:Transcript_17255/g.44070  ORF Transcript_17255/g.44070 Transcript_17255/m.44070 type:complete len:241 (-) Transcript_17255:306-1028(-)